MSHPEGCLASCVALGISGTRGTLNNQPLLSTWHMLGPIPGTGMLQRTTSLGMPLHGTQDGCKHTLHTGAVASEGAGLPPTRPGCPLGR